MQVNSPDSRHGGQAFIHNLYRLAEKADLKLSEDQKEQLVTITAFNINAL